MAIIGFGACSKKASVESLQVGELTVDEATRAVPPAGGNVTLYWDQFPPEITVNIGSAPCTIISQSDTAVTCSVGAISNPRWEYATVSLQSTGNVLLRSNKKIALGAVVVGQTSPATGSFSTNTGLDVPNLVFTYGDKIGVPIGSDLLTWDEDVVTNRILPDFSPISASATTNTDYCWNGTQFFAGDVNRIKVYGAIPTDFSAFSYVIGQSDTTSNLVNQGLGAPTERTLSGLRQIACDANYLFVADYGNHRVLAYALPITTTNPAAIRVLGQSDFISNASNQGGARTLATMNNPMAVAWNGSFLVVGDYSNRRALLWNGFPANNGDPAFTALGQATASGAATGCAATRFGAGPRTASFYGNWLALNDVVNHRTLLYDLTAAGGIATWGFDHAATRVLGQADFTTCTANRGSAPTLGSHRTPRSAIFTPSGKLVVSDYQNNRLLVWNSVPGVDGAAADFVLGQSDGTRSDTRAGWLSANTVYDPYGASLSGDTLFVPSLVHSRAMIFHLTASSNHFPAASLVLGQVDLTRSEVNNTDGTISATSLTIGVYTQILADGTFLLDDRENNRLLAWNSEPTVNRQAPDYVLGKSTFTTASGASSSSVGAFRNGVSCGTQFLVQDTNRVLVFNGWMSAKTSGPTADYVIGQADFATTSANRGLGSTQQDAFSTITGLACDGNYLWVSDYANNRVLRFTLPITADTPTASLVLGQTDFVSSIQNAGLSAANAQGFDGPRGLTIHEGKLYVTDTGNHRVLIWDSLPTANGQAASRVFGQANFTAASRNRGSTTTQVDSFYSPAGISLSNGRMAVSDLNNQRVLVLPIPLD